MSELREKIVSGIDEGVIADIDTVVQRSLGLAFADDQEMAIRKAIISAFIVLSNATRKYP